MRRTSGLLTAVVASGAGAAFGPAGGAGAYEISFDGSVGGISGLSFGEVFYTDSGDFAADGSGAGIGTIEEFFASVQTGAGIIDEMAGNAEVSRSDVDVSASAVNSRGAGVPRIVVHVSAEAFIVDGYTGGIETNVAFNLPFEINAPTEYHIVQFGNFSDPVFIQEDTGTITGNTLSAGRFRLRIQPFLFGVEGVGPVMNTEQGGYIILLPSPGAAAVLGAGMVVVAGRRRRGGG